MFKKSRRKIVAAIMSVLVLLFLGTLAVIYSSSYFEVSSTNHEMLKRYSALYSLDEQPGDSLPPDNITPPDTKPAIGTPKDFPDGPHFEDTPAFQLSTFYSVAVSGNGELLAIDNNDRALYEDIELERYAFEIIEGKKTTGVKGNLIYLTTNKGDYTLVAFMDNTIMQESMTTLFRYTLVFGSIAIIALFFVAVYLARRIVKPLEESYQKQTQFISDAGHELKTPVSVVNANAELLAKKIGNNQWLANIQYENERMGKLVGQLLELARTENVTVKTEHLDFSHLVGGEALPFESLVFEKGLLLNCDIENSLIVNGNSIQLKQLVSILLDNAIHHGSGGKEVTLQLKKEHSSAKLSVINDGNPIPAEQQKLLFDRFYRVDSVRNSEDKHYGLGLAIAKAIVSAHKGKISVACYDGKVEFSVLLPLKK
jgi:signal transduction histidine kinase